MVFRTQGLYLSRSPQENFDGNLWDERPCPDFQPLQVSTPNQVPNRAHGYLQQNRYLVDPIDQRLKIIRPAIITHALPLYAARCRSVPSHAFTPHFPHLTSCSFGEDFLLREEPEKPNGFSDQFVD
jgi:hypothetical protein